ncbi:Protein KRBA1, partial [Camelus dromedarius]
AAEIGLPLLGCEAPGLSRRPPRPSPAACAPDPISSCVDLGHRRRRGSRRSLRTRSGCPRPRRKRGAEAEPVMARQLGTARLASLGGNQPNPLGLCPQVPVAFQDLAVRFSEDEWRLLGEKQRALFLDVMQENYETLVSLGGAPQHSLHLTALVQLVKEIPEFLFGEVSPQSGGAGLDGEGASPEAAVMEDTCPLQGPLGCLPDTPISRPGLAATPSGSSSSGPSGARGQGSPFPTGPTGATIRATLTTGGLAGAAEISPGNSPLQGLINCLKEILEPGPQPSEGPLGVPHPVPTGASRLTRAELGPASPPWAVKTEAASGDCPLQGLLNCLKEIPEPRDRHPSPSAAGDSRLQEDPAAWKRSSGGPRPLQTPPPGPGPGPGAGSVLSVVKTEDGWAPSLLLPVSCQLSKQMHSPTAAGSPGDSGDTTRVQVSCWGPAAQEVVMGPLLALGLQGCMRDSPALPPGSQGTPTSFSSSSSTDGDLDFQSSEGSQGHRRGKGELGGQSLAAALVPPAELGMPWREQRQDLFWACPLRQRVLLPVVELVDRGFFCCHLPEPASKPSPLHCLENSLKGILPGGPLRFACLASPSASTSASPGSSFSSSEGEDLRPEPELWQPLLPERDRLPSCKGLGPLSLRPGGPCARSSPGEGPKKGEPKYHCGLSAGEPGVS